MCPDKEGGFENWYLDGAAKSALIRSACMAAMGGRSWSEDHGARAPGGGGGKNRKGEPAVGRSISSELLLHHHRVSTSL